MNGALLPTMGGGKFGTAALGAVTNGLQTLVSNTINTGSPTAPGQSGYQMLQSMALGAIGGWVGGAFKPPFDPSVPALLQKSLIQSQAASGNLVRNTLGGAISGAPSVTDPCGCQ